LAAVSTADFLDRHNWWKGQDGANAFSIHGLDPDEMTPPLCLIGNITL